VTADRLSACIAQARRAGLARDIETWFEEYVLADFFSPTAPLR
jgi:hypothetical protein